MEARPNRTAMVSARRRGRTGGRPAAGGRRGPAGGAVPAERAPRRRPGEFDYRDIGIRIEEAEAAPAAFAAGTETICPVLRRLAVEATWTARPAAGGGTAAAGRAPRRSPGRGAGEARPGWACFCFAAPAAS